MSKKKHLIIGCGTAAISAVRKIRSISSEDEIRLVTMEEYPPYSPAVLPYLLSGRISQSDMWLVPEGFFKQTRSSLQKSSKVTQVLPETRELIYQNKTRDNYDSLLISSGSEPVVPPIKGLERGGFLGFHTFADCKKLRQLLDERKEIAIYGGGLVALQLAAALLQKGYQVTIIVRSRILRRYFDGDAAAFIEDIFRNQGAQIYAGTEISDVNMDKAGIEMALSDRNCLRAELLISCIGVKPRVSFLGGSGINISQGILVDNRMRTNIPHVFAAGDVAEASNFFTGTPGVNPIGPSAVQQGKIAGANMVGQEREDFGWIPMNVFKCFGHTACSVGLAASERCQAFKEKSNKDGRYKELVFQENRLVGARFLDIDVDPGVIRYLIENKVDTDPWKEMLFDKPKEVSRWLMLEAERKGR